jgi:hypothetical protein
LVWDELPVLQLHAVGKGRGSGVIAQGINAAPVAAHIVDTADGQIGDLGIINDAKKHREQENIHAPL